ncbi:hypothetical protein EIP86_002065 [Pleurotus ostreatoroseus]|nr:hypothetical protein EIP86_002065 [Pleurotus ostreatoroseus]
MNLQNAYYGDADVLDDATMDKGTRFSKFEFGEQQPKMEDMYRDMAYDYREEDEFLDEYEEE